VSFEVYIKVLFKKERILQPVNLNVDGITKYFINKEK